MSIRINTSPPVKTYTLRDAEGPTALWHARNNDADEAAALLFAYGAYEEPEQEDQ